MKAAVYTEYGNPEVLKIQEVEKPLPKSNEVLVRISATAVNSGDVRLRKADPFAVRFMMGLTKPKIQILGGVFAGTVEAVGDQVKKFKVGDAVFGSTNLKFGAYAEYKCFGEAETIAIKPAHLSMTEAAVLPFGGTTALYFLRKANLQAGQKILIYGASGAVGTAAVQLARMMGAQVTAVCSAGNHELVKNLGAHQVIDYRKTDFTSLPDSYDVIYDTVNKVPVNQAFKKLNAKGKLILGAADMRNMLLGSFRGMFSGKKVLMGMIKQSQAEIAFLADAATRAEFKPVIDRTYPLDEIAAAHAYVDQGHKKGNVAITL